jgi:uncharacterized phiE125 gp8 family phage protein
MTWLPPVVTVAPATEPVTLAEAKTHCRVDGSDSDSELGAMIAAARGFVEDYCGVKLVSQTVVLRCSSFCDLVDLPIAPISAVTGVTYLDSSGVEQTLSTDVYEAVLTDLEPHIRLKINQSWPSIRCASDAIRVTASAGYASLPAPIHHTVLLLIGHWFDNRSTVNVGNIVNDLPFATEALLSNYRRF